TEIVVTHLHLRFWFALPTNLQAGVIDHLQAPLGTFAGTSRIRRPSREFVGQARDELATLTDRTATHRRLNFMKHVENRLSFRDGLLLSKVAISIAKVSLRASAAHRLKGHGIDDRGDPFNERGR